MSSGERAPLLLATLVHYQSAIDLELTEATIEEIQADRGFMAALYRSLGKPVDPGLNDKIENWIRETKIQASQPDKLSLSQLIYLRIFGTS